MVSDPALWREVLVGRRVEVEPSALHLPQDEVTGRVSELLERFDRARVTRAVIQRLEALGTSLPSRAVSLPSVGGMHA